MQLVYITNIQLPASDAQSIQVSAMAKAFNQKLGDNFLLISPLNNENISLSEGWQWRRLRVGNNLPRFLRYFFTIIFSIPGISKFKPDIIYSRDIGLVFFYRFLGFKCVYEIHKPFETKIGDWFFRRLLQRIKVVAISQTLKNFVLEKYEIGNNGVLVAHDGVWLEEYTKLDHQVCKKKLCEELKINEDRNIVFYSSNLYKGKGLEIVIELAKQYADKYFVIMGNRDAGEIIEYPTNMFHIGRKSPGEVPFYTKSADLLLMPFNKELKTWKYHSALKMFEYLASGVPILSSNIGSITEVFNERNSYLFNPENISEAVESVKYIFDNYNEALEKARQALEDVKEYTWEKRTQKILDFIII